MPAVGDVELAVEAVGAGVGLGAVLAHRGQVDAADELGDVLAFGVGGHEGADAGALLLREEEAPHRDAVDVLIVFVAQVEGAHRAQLALDEEAVGVQELLAQGVGDEVQGVFVLRTIGDGVDRPLVGVGELLQATLEQDH